jgi:hypothetical protein
MADDNIAAPVVNETPASTPSEENKNVSDMVPRDRLNEVIAKNKELEDKLNSQTPPPAPPKAPDVPLNEEGYIDPVKYAAQIEENALKRFRAESALQQDWNVAEQQYPKLKSSKRLANAVKGLQLEAVNEGRFLSASEAAKELFEEIEAERNAGKDEGTAEAQASEEIQRRAGLDVTPGGKSNSGGDDLVTRYRAGKLTPTEIRANWSKIQAGLQGS